MNEEKNKLKIDHYILGKTLGNGAFGKVKLAYHDLLNENHKVAIKIINKNQLKNLNLSSKMKREIKILRSFDHPNIVKVFQVLETNSKLFIVMEYLEGGEFFDYLCKNAPLSEDEAKFFLKQIISGIEYCQFNRVVHRDLKPENLLLTKNNILKIIDFGLSNYLNDGKALKTSCGSLRYAAPEILNGKKYIGNKIDIWSIGIILYTMLHGSFPFDDDVTGNLILKISKGEYKIRNDLSSEVINLITMMLEKDPFKRITINEIKCHTWFKTINEGLNSMPPLMLEYYSKFYKNQIHEQCFNKIINKDFDFKDYNKDQIINKILNKRENSFVIGYLILFNERRNKKLKNEKNLNSSKDLEKDNSFIFKSFIKNYDMNLDKVNEILMEKYKFYLNNKEHNWHLGIKIKKNFFQLILDFLNLCKEEDIKVNIKNKNKFKFLCTHKGIIFMIKFYKDSLYDLNDGYSINLMKLEGNPLIFLSICNKINLKIKNFN